MKYSFREQYDEKRDAKERDAAAIYNDEPSMTQQQFTADADINEVMRRFGVEDGSLPPARFDWNAVDLSEAGDFQSVTEKIRLAKDMFMQLPADLRESFNNDPARMMDWVHDPKNLDEATELGFWKKPEPTPGEATPPEPPPTQS